MFLCFDSLSTEGVCQGRILNVGLPEATCFQGLDQMLLKMDRICDRWWSPQSFIELRDGQPRRGAASVRTAFRPCHTAQELYVSFGRAMVAAVRIVYRQNASWQGNMAVPGVIKGSVAFRSALELLNILDYTLKEDAVRRKLDLTQ